MAVAYFRYDKVNENDSIDIKYQKLVFNTGNLIYDYAIPHLISCDVFNRSQFNSVILNGYSKVIIMDFCYIYNGRDFSFLKKLFNTCVKKGIEIIPLSVGIHTVTGNREYKIDKEHLWYLNIMSEMGNIPTRGEQTAEILYLNGIKNAEPIGCPSFFINKNHPVKLREKKSISRDNCICNFYDLMPWSNQNYLKYLYKNTSLFIDQKIKYHDSKTEYKKVYSEEIFNFFIKDLKVFFSAEEWFYYLKNSQFIFSIGPRMHGNVISILSGIRSLILANDSRRAELCDLAKIPYIYLKDFNTDKPMQYYYELADYSNFFTNYSTIWNNFCNYVNKRGLVLSS